MPGILLGSQQDSAVNVDLLKNFMKNLRVFISKFMQI